MPPKKQPKKAPIKPTAVQEASPIPQEESEKKEEAQPIQPKPASPIKETKPVQNPKASPPKVQPHQEVDQKIDSVKKNSVDSLGEDKSSNNVIKLNQFNNFVAPKPPTQGGISEEEKKRLREMRFAGKNTSENTFEIIQTAEQEKLKMMERSKRFGLINQDEEDEKKKKRAERFHVAAGSNPDSDNLKKVERAKRFGMLVPEEEEEKKKLRATKFGTAMNISSLEGGQFLRDKKLKTN